jgi:predicted ATPase
MDILRAAFDVCNRTGWTISYPEFLGVLAEGLGELGEITEAIATIDKALALADNGGETWFNPELLRTRSELLLLEGGNRSVATAESCLYEALAVAQAQGALLWELKAALSLARLRLRQNRQAEAQSVLSSVYDRFSEGFEAVDVRAARALLDSLSSHPHPDAQPPRNRG